MKRLIVLGLLAAFPAYAPAYAEDPAPLKPGAGGELAASFCNACHTSNYIIMNSTFLTPAAWKAEVTKMRTAFGAPIDDETATAIIDYLSANYAVRK